jgi:aminoglycoside phosphotransferase
MNLRRSISSQSGVVLLTASTERDWLQDKQITTTVVTAVQQQQQQQQIHGEYITGMPETLTTADDRREPKHAVNAVGL